LRFLQRPMLAQRRRDAEKSDFQTEVVKKITIEGFWF
jgi:hypothetical protein